jgi:hypothetical protein
MTLSLTNSLDETRQSEEDGDGRDSNGRFKAGHRLSIGNRGGRHRARLLDEISEDDVASAVRTCREIMLDAKASAKDRLVAANCLLDRVCGKAAMSDLEDRMGAVEEALARIVEHFEVTPA